MNEIAEADGRIEAEGELHFYDSFWDKIEEIIGESPLFDLMLLWLE